MRSLIVIKGLMNLKVKMLLSFLLAGLVVIVTACGTESNPVDSNSSKDITDKVTAQNTGVAKQIISRNNEIGFKIFSEVEADQHGNLFISPTSLFMALSMVYNGADGQTKEEIANVLGLKGITSEELNKENASLLSILQKDSDKIQLSIANSIWLERKFHFQKDFSQNNEAYFQAEIEEIDVLDDDSVEQINSWVENATQQKIKDIVEAPLDPDLVAILINAIYFKGDWTHAFNEKQTENGEFHLSDGRTREIPLMFLNEALAYIENDKFQAVKLPYGDGEMSMQVYLPKENSSLTELRKMITAENWSGWSSAFKIQEGALLLPRFQLEYEILLNDTLKKLGMASAFRKGANFSKMIEEADPLWISKVLQKTFLEVNEKGTEAAAATVIEVVTESAVVEVNPPFYMEVNRPFFIAITEEETGVILFMGAIENPQE